MITKPITPYQPKNPLRQQIGAGDVVAAIVQPVARVSDAILGTALLDCAACKSRRAELNAASGNLNPFAHAND